MSGFDGLMFWKFLYDHGVNASLSASFEIDLGRSLVRMSAYFLLYATIIDSISSIVRVVFRITYFFEKKFSRIR